MKKQEFYRRHLPHLHIPDQTFFITWLLKGALPKSLVKKIVKLNQLKDEEVAKVFTESPELNQQMQSDYFNEFDFELDSIITGSHYLRKTDIAKIVAKSLHYWDNKKIDLICYCIMSNHVHAVFSVLEFDEHREKVFWVDIMESIKKYSARECNKEIGRKGQFWHHESYDRLIRDREELYRTIIYILDNPVKAGHCKSRSSYTWSYIKPEYQHILND